MSHDEVPKTQRALVFQGGGALGAYDAGVFSALYEKIGQKEGFDKLFDIVAGTSSGAMNGAILVSHVIENKTWQGSQDELSDFWRYVSTDVDLRYWYPYAPTSKDWVSQWNIQKQLYPNLASGESARRYYSTKQFLCSGVPHVYLPQFSTPCQPFNGPPRADYKFLDNFSVPVNNTWYIYTNQPLKESLARFAKFPIATSFDRKQPRLLLVSVDVQEGAVVTFDSYPKNENGIIRKSWYGNYDSKNGRHEYTISYSDGIRLDYAVASGSFPINYDYTKIADVNRLDSIGNSASHKVTRYFWDGGILSNTPLRELIQWHKDYWYRVMGKEADNAPVPNLDVYIVDVWPTREENIPLDHDGALDRKEDLLLNDKTDYDQKVADIVSDYITLFHRTREVALNYIKGQNEKKSFQTDLDKLLTKEGTKSKHRTGQPRQYKDLINGRFDIKVTRIERTKNVGYDICNKAMDYSMQTIQQLIQDGYDDAIEQIK
jgi:predicted acylesterase/phospholipase RssA